MNNSLTDTRLSEQEVLDAVQQELALYCGDLKDYIDVVEVYFGAIPDGVLNEVRNFTGHIAAAYADASLSTEAKLENIQSAHTHLRRMLLDCLKLMCIHQQDYIRVFRKKYRFYNLNDVDDGNFMANLHKYEKKAEEAFIDAKKSDKTGKNSGHGQTDVVYDNYITAYNEFCVAVKYIDDHYEGIVRVAVHHTFWTFVSLLGWAIGIAVSLA